MFYKNKHLKNCPLAGSLCILLLLISACNRLGRNLPDEAGKPLSLCMPITSDTTWYSSGKKAPLFEGLDVVHFPITTDRDLAQRYFNQGMALAYGFNHAEAARSFYYATRLDPECAMCYWGCAYVLGPNYNGGMESGNYLRAYNAIQKALQLSDEGTEKEKALILAMAKRYVKVEPEDRSALDKAYSDAMKKLFERFPRDANIGAMYAESIMDLHPWDIWGKDGSKREWTDPILNTLRKVLEIDPKHVGANHFYIHAVEASAHPEMGYESARLFDEGLVPGSGHLVHMPSHIYIRTGDYHKGSWANIRAIQVDSGYISACHAQGVYPIAYMPHNYHFLAATATLAGNSRNAIVAAEKLSEGISVQLMQQPGWGTLQHYFITPWNVYVKFGKWDKILAREYSINSRLAYPQAMRHYAKGMAFLGKGNVGRAEKELAMLEKTMTNERLKEISIWNINSVYELVQIANLVLQGEIMAHKGHFDNSISQFKKAVAIEDGLNYNEPPDWFFSVRHHLGVVQLEAGLPLEAEKTYREDLNNFPKNGWALLGLYQSLRAEGKNEEAEKTKEKFKKAWKHADVKLTSSRII